MSYLNTKPLLHGLAVSGVANDINLSVDYPSKLARQLRDDELDVALLPVAAIPEIPNARIISDYGIASDGNVVSVALFSAVPMEQITGVYLDYQSRTSVRLAQVLLKEYWKRDVEFLIADKDYISKIGGSTAAVIIGDRALQHLTEFPYNYDLSAAWKAYTGLDFIFAAWVANKDLPDTFVSAFNAGNAEGLAHLDAVISQNHFPHYSLHTYYTDNIKFHLDEAKKAGLQRFLALI